MILRSGRLRSPRRTLTPGVRRAATAQGILFCAAAGLVGLSAPALAQQAHVGYVLDLRGEWYLSAQPSRPLARADRVPAGGKVYARNSSREDYIVMARRDGAILARRDCGSAGGCDAPIELPSSVVAKTSLLEAALETVIGLMWGNPRRNPRGGVRGEELQEAVVRWGRESLDLTPLFRTAPDTRFCVRLRPLPRRSAAKGDGWIGPAHTGGAAAPSVRLRGIEPGLYEIELRHSAGRECQERRGGAWILVPEPEKYEKALAAFREAEAAAERWGDDPLPGPAVKRQFLRAYLEYLAAN